MVVDADRSPDLFQRSDNYPFALQGIPAYTIMSSDDYDECYHRSCDRIERLDIQHIASIVKAIIQGCTTIVNGEDTL